MEIFKEFLFDAAHRLPHAPEGHKAGHVHGHPFKMAVHVDDPVDSRLAWVMDFVEIKSAS